MSSIIHVSRREFLTALGLTTAGLCLGAYAADTNVPVDLKTNGPLSPNVFITIAKDGIVTIICHRSEMGQGIRSSLPVLMADEMGADMKNVRIIQAEGDKKYGDQNTDGSTSIRTIFDKMRTMAAMARELMIEAAANKWKVSRDTLTAENHFVIQKGSKKKISFGELAEDAARLAIPSEGSVKLRPLKELKNLGKDLPLIDGPDLVSGRARFGADIRLPNMLIAVIARPTVMGARVKKFDAKEALKIPGVKKVIELPTPKPPYGFQQWGGVAVLAENTWAAIQGREALKIDWELGEHKSYNSQKYREDLLKSASKPGTTHRSKGDAEKALKDAHKVIEASYYVPHLPHQPMEPPAALADYQDGYCEVWACTQNPQSLRTEVAKITKLSEDQVKSNVMFLGGGFGRKSKSDFAVEAAWLSKEVKRPVRVQFTREDDIHNDYINTVNAQVLTAGVDKEGKVTAWRHRSAYPPIPYLFDAKSTTPGPGDFQQGILDLAIDVPNIEAQGCEAPVHARIGWLRSVYNIFHAFGISSFMDEIAHQTKQDPFDFMMNLYADKDLTMDELGVKELRNYRQPLEEHPVSGKRVKRALKAVAEISNWKNRKKVKDRGWGIAVHRSFLSYIAVAASVKKNKDGAIRVDEVWVAVDAGIVVNSDRVRAQMEGSVINGITYLFFGGVTHKDGAVVESNFDEARILSMDLIPRKIHVKIVESNDRPGGIGEPGLPPVAPAIANAIFDLTGKRIREFASKDIKFA